VTRFQRLAAATAAATFILIAVGGLVRATDSGLGCPDWPRCFGKLAPPPELHAWIEHSHRLVASVIVVLVSVLAVAAWRSGQARSVRWSAVGAVALVLGQALLGAIVVWRKLEAESVTLHLATALALLALLEFIAFRSRWPARDRRATTAGADASRTAGAAVSPAASDDASQPASVVASQAAGVVASPAAGMEASRASGGNSSPAGAEVSRAAGTERSRRFARLTVVGAGLVYAQMLVGSTVTGRDAGLAFPDFPLMNGRLVPDLTLTTARLQVLHRGLAMLVGVVIVLTWLRARRTQWMHPTVTRLAGYASGLVVVQIALGIANVWNRLSALTVVPHLAVGSLLWGVVFLLALHASRFTGTGRRDPAEPEPGPRRTARQAAGAYFLLTKPRIIELLLVTTIPTMFIAARGLPSPWLVLATLLGGSLSAASANTINCYLDRDIDQVMRRTAHRPLPTHRVDPADALRFGVVLGVAGFVWLWATVNLLSAALATAAILFYVFVYTLGLKRRSTQNIVIGGAAGAVPVLVGWSAVTGTIDLPALVLFAIIFYWTPPHFWALSLKYREDYAAAGVPMLPVVRGPRETSHQILYYTLLLVAVTLLLYPAGQMGAIYLAAALGLGAMFVWRAAQLWRDASGQRAIRLFSFSNRYLALLFAAMAVDAVVRISG
jgi:protoheme IX farnesyltransferase